MQSRAPEYSGSSELPPVKDPQTLAAVGGEPVPSASGSAAPPPPSAAPPPEVVVPRLPGTPELTKDGLYVFTGGGLELAVDPRIGVPVRLSLDGKNVLAPTEPNVDARPYSAEIEGSTLVLKSASGGLLERYRLDSARRSIDVTYTVVNVATGTARVIGAEVDRVPAAGGLTFFPSPQKLLPGSTLKLNIWQPLVWFSHDQNRADTTLQAASVSSEGWLASVSDAVLLVKTFAASSEVTLLVKAAYDPQTKTRPWVELGEQCEFELAPGASATWNVRFFLRKLPPSIAAKPGNQELVGFVRGVIQ